MCYIMSIYMYIAPLNLTAHIPGRQEERRGGEGRRREGRGGEGRGGEGRGGEGVREAGTSGGSVGFSEVMELRVEPTERVE